jgi:NAD(P)H-nitrite reductase large subunit
VTSTDSAPLAVMPVERKDGTYALRLCLSQGEMTIGMVKRVMEAMDHFNLTTLRATTGQRMNLEGIPKDRLDEVVAALGTAVEKCPPGVSVCPGGGICKYGVQETRELGRKLEAVIKQNGPYPFKIKSGVSGCRMGCGLSFVRDIGLVSRAKGWDLYFGGSAVGTPTPGVLLGSALSSEEVVNIVTRALAFYKENAHKRERIGKMVQRLGHEAVSAALR